MVKKTIKVLIVDDSALVRKILRDGLSQDPLIEVVGAAHDPYHARDLIVYKKPDVVTLDIEMPKMNGLDFLRKLMPQYPLPVIMVSSLSEKGCEITLNALELGAIDFITKPKSDLKNGMNLMMKDLLKKIHMAYRNRKSIVEKAQNLKNLKTTEKISSLKKTTDKIIVMGASTGGTEAIATILSQLPADFPGLVIVQHMPPVFTRSFAKRLNGVCKMEVKEAEHNDRIIKGRILIAEGGKQLTIKRSGGQYIVKVGHSELVSGHCPSVDELFYSVADQVGANAIGVILTGMGKDGAEGLLKMKEKGARTIAQDEKTSVVYGMPKAAYDIGAIECIRPLNKIAKKLYNILSEMDA
jgi:two-component system, chemotaxis family, protein-glutamate methylesterase/glutaminase